MAKAVTVPAAPRNALREPENARDNGFSNFETLQMDWRFPPPELCVPLLLASDLIYEMRNVGPLVQLVKKVLLPGGQCLLMCFSEHQPGDLGPRRVTQDELRTAFGNGWELRSIEAASFETRDGSGAQAWLAMLDRR